MLKIMVFSSCLALGASAYADQPAQQTATPTQHTSELHTSEYWYHHPQQGDFWSEYEILDPDGWRHLADPRDYWYHQKMPRQQNLWVQSGVGSAPNV